MASVTEHLPGACGGHDARKGTYRLRASGVSRFEQSVTRDSPTFVPNFRKQRGLVIPRNRELILESAQERGELAGVVGVAGGARVASVPLVGGDSPASSV